MEEQQTRGESGAEELRLFPLNVILFPGMPMPLRIFEERYKVMIGECILEEAPFGIVLIREGPETGGGALPYKIGTTARIAEVERLEDGRMNLATKGEKRFQIEGTVHEHPYLKGLVRYMGEEVGDLDREVLEKARDLFSEYLRNLSGVRGGWSRQAEVPDGPVDLSYSIAHYLDLPVLAKQRLLEVPTVQERIQYELPLLEGANQRIREEIIKRNPYQGPKLN